MGVVDAERGAVPRALEAVRLVHRLDPARRALDPGSYRPKIVQLYAQAGATPETRETHLDVVTEPPGAEVWIDGRRAGTAPLARSLGVGFHYVAAAAEGSAPRIEKPLLRAGEDTRLSLLLSRAPPEERARQARVELAAGQAIAWRKRGPAAIANTSASRLYDLLVVADARRARAGGRGIDLRRARRIAGRVDAGVARRARARGAGRRPRGADARRQGAARARGVQERATCDHPRPRRRGTGRGGSCPRSWPWARPSLSGRCRSSIARRTTTYATIGRWCFNNSCAP